MKKAENYKLEKIEKPLKVYIKMEKTIIRFGEIQNFTNIKDLFQ